MQGDGKALAYIALGQIITMQQCVKSSEHAVLSNKPVLLKYITIKTFEQHIVTVIRQEPGELKLNYLLQQATINYPYMYIFSHHTQEPTTIDGLFMSLSKLPAYMEKTVQHLNYDSH